MALQADKHGLGGCDAAGAGEAVGEGDLGGIVGVAGGGLLAVEDNFGLVVLRGRGQGEGLDRLDAGDSGGDEVVQVVGGENGTHGAGCSGGSERLLCVARDVVL